MKQRRKQQIGQAAAEVLARHGLQGLSMQAVATAAGLAKSVVLYHVRDSAGLLDLVAETLESRQDLTRAPLCQADGDPRRWLGQWLADAFDDLERAESTRRLAWTLQCCPAPPELLRTSLQRDVHALALLLARGDGHACWRAPDAHRLALAVRALVDGFLLQALAASDAPARQQLRADCRDAVMDLLLR